MRFTQRKGGEHLTVRTCVLLFCTLATAGRIALIGMVIGVLSGMRFAKVKRGLMRSVFRQYFCHCAEESSQKTIELSHVTRLV